MLIGLSLSFCVKDIIEGKIDMNDVKFISSGTKAKSAEDWDSVIDSYKRFYWMKNPVEGERVARYFIENGMIIQPRLEGRLIHLGGVRADQHWLDESEYNQFAKEHTIDL